jgi:UDP-N-acetylmuramoylalanine-D-glutamate ligase
VDLGGKTPEEAAAAIQDATANTFYTQSMTVQLPDCTLSLTPEQTGAGVDAQAIAQLAFAYGRGGNRWENTQAKAAAALDTYYLDTRSCMTLNEDAIRAAVEAAPHYKAGCPEIIVTAPFVTAVETARDRAVEGDVVTLSPACAAFDQFKNFMVRGKTFKAIVNGWEE